jgi:hypothetical protein
LFPLFATPALPGVNLLSVSLTPGANLPPVWLMLVVHLDLKTPRIFEKILNNPEVILRSLEEDDSRKNLKQKIS